MLRPRAPRAGTPGHGEEGLCSTCIFILFLRVSEEGRGRDGNEEGHGWPASRSPPGDGAPTRACALGLNGTLTSRFLGGRSAPAHAGHGAETSKKSDLSAPGAGPLGVGTGHPWD